MESIFIMLVAFQLKHFLADYPLQTTFMLRKDQLTGWFLPLLSHVSVHAGLSLLIIFYFAPHLWWLALIDGAVHSIVDWIKASPKMLNRFTPAQAYFWWSFGADQMLHHLTNYFMVFMIASHTLSL